MSSIKESALQSDCIDYLKNKGIYYINKFGDGRSGKGCPDLIVCLNGYFVAFELKVGDNDLAPAQRIHKKRILRSGGRHYKPYTIEEFKRIIDDLEKELGGNHG